jgi:hypothetical protein
MEATMNNVQERLPILAGANMLGARDGDETVQWMQNPGIALPANDRISPIFRPIPGLPALPGTGVTTLPIVSQLLSIIQQLLAMFGFGRQSSVLPNYYQNATASSTGDPHLAFNGTDANGNASEHRFDSMTAHRDLLDSDSFTGGYQISTAVTQPGPKGVTYNRQATISTNDGRTQVTLEKGGDAYVMQGGRRYGLSSGESYNIGNGETVRRNGDGSVVVSDTNAENGSIITTLSENGNGVDVRAQAQNVDLGGDLVAQAPLQALL